VWKLQPWYINYQRAELGNRILSLVFICLFFNVRYWFLTFFFIIVASLLTAAVICDDDENLKNDYYDDC